MILQNNKQKAFTIVELLIVIVVIGILAAISIVAYNGIQNRARDTTNQDMASQLRSKIETWNSVKGSYPTQAQIGGGLVDTDAPEARLSADIVSKLTGTVAATKGSTSPQSFEDNEAIQAVPCPASGTVTGVNITYWKAGTNGTLTAGSC